MSLVATELSLQDEFNETQSAEKSIILAILAELGMDSALATDLCSKEDIQNFFKSKMKSVDPTTLSTADLFRKMGFGMTAPLIQDWLNDKDNHFMVEEWLMYFIQNSFQRNAPLPQWAEAENSGQEFSFQGAWDSGDQTRTFKQGHIPGSSPSDDLNEEIQLAIAESSEDEDCIGKVWFHLTTIESAENILYNGIDLKCGRQRANFSFADGVYLGSDLNKTLENLAKRKFYKLNYVACLVFSIPRDSDPLEQFPGLKLSDPSKEDQLRKVVSYFSNLKFPPTPPNLDTDGLPEDYKSALQFIVGPYCYFQGTDCRTQDVQINGSVTQLCIRGRDLKSTFERLMLPKIFILDLAKISKGSRSSLGPEEEDPEDPRHRKSGEPIV